MRCIFRNKIYKFNSLLGLLYSNSTKRTHTELELVWDRKLNKKHKLNIESILNPYNTPIKYPNPSLKDIYPKSLIYYAKLLIWGYTHCYPILWFLSKFRFNVFPSAINATDAFCKIIGDNQDTLCLPRSIFVATTSSRFRNFGILVIGAALPSRHMHAWVMEDGRNAWRNDSYWINYIPVAIMK